MENYHMTIGTPTPEQQAAIDVAAKATAAADAAALAAATAAPGQPASSPATLAGGAPEGYIEVARFNGVMQRNEALSDQLKTSTGNLALRTSELEQSGVQIANLEAAQEVKATEINQQVTQLNEQVTTLTAAGAEYASLQLKLKVANEMGRPDLMALAGHIPNSLDEAVIKETLTAFAGFSAGAVKAREEQLLAGTSPAGSGGGQAPSVPTTPQGWADHINTFGLGTPEREAALTAYGKAVQEHTNL
jgi:hypothetical protein